MKTKVIYIISAVISAAAALGVNTVLHPCKGEMAMKCVHTTQVGTVVLAVLVILQIAAVLSKNAVIRKVIAGLSVAGAAAVFFVPKLGHCGGAMMHCNTHTMPAFYVAGVILFIASLIAISAEIMQLPQVSKK